MTQKGLSQRLALMSLFVLAACNSILGNKERPLASDSSSVDGAGADDVATAGSSGNAGSSGATSGSAAGAMSDGAGHGAGGRAGMPNGGAVANNGGSSTGGCAGGTGGKSSSGGTAGAMANGGTAGAMANGGTAGTIANGGTAGTIASGGTAGTIANGGTSGAAATRPDGPCDIYAVATTKCAAAYSTIRALSKTYNGPLYQVRNGSSATNTGTGGTTLDIGLTADGFANSVPQDTFCSGSICTISILYDQSGNKNDLKVAPKGQSSGGMYGQTDDFESSATKGAVTVGGHNVYALYMNAREGYRLTATGVGMSVGNTAQGIYMLADGTHTGSDCCWDFGNVSTNPLVYTTTTALFLGEGFWGSGAGARTGPWFMGDFEGGVWAGGTLATGYENNPNNPLMKVPFAFGVLKTSPGQYAIRAADVASATDLTTAYDGTSPKAAWTNQGGIVLGVGEDNSNNSWGTFYEGAITAGRPSDATDLAVMKNVQNTGYGK